MNQAKARKHLIQYGICLSRQVGPIAERWLTTPCNKPGGRRCFATIQAAVGCWDEQARWLAFDTALAKATLAQERGREAPDLVAAEDEMERRLRRGICNTRLVPE